MRNKPPDHTKVTNDQIIEAIRASRGNVSDVARKLRVCRYTIHMRANKVAAVAKALKETRDAMIDDVETVLHERALAGEAWAVCFFLKTQAKDRGYVERQEIRHGQDAEAPFVFNHQAVATAITTGSGEYRLPPGSDSVSGNGETVG